MPDSKPVICAVFASGNGSNAENILRHARHYPQRLHIPVVICDRPDAFVVERARQLGVDCKIVPKGEEGQILNILEERGVRWVFLAGYMRILKPAFLQHFFDPALGVHRVVNIHPSLLPAFPGKDAYKQAFEAGVKTSGVTLHFADAGVDTGPVISQASFERLPDDTLESFRQRGMELEYKLYRDFIDYLAGAWNTEEKKWARH